MSPTVVSSAPPADPYTAWRTGHVAPGRITLALAYIQMPQLAAAYVCGTDAETVDLWERGAEYPSWGQLVDLAAVTGQPVEFFMRPVEGDGALFLVPPAWRDGGAEPLRAACCVEAVALATEDAPVSVEGWFAAAFV